MPGDACVTWAAGRDPTGGKVEIPSRGKAGYQQKGCQDAISCRPMAEPQAPITYQPSRGKVLLHPPLPVDIPMAAQSLVLWAGVV